jgi:hypothetical protein
MSSNPLDLRSIKNPFSVLGGLHTGQFPFAQTAPLIVGGDGQYLGRFSSSPVDPDSISNPVGKYGSPVSPFSVNNPVGRYGSPVSPLSATNPMATQPPRLFGSSPAIVALPLPVPMYVAPPLPMYPAQPSYSLPDSSFAGSLITAFEAGTRERREEEQHAAQIEYYRREIQRIEAETEAMRSKLGTTANLFGKSDGLPARWKSLNSGTTKLLRFDGDRIYIESVMSEAARQHGDFILAETRKSGDTYVGALRYQMTCSFSTLMGQLAYNHCRFEDQIELTSVAPNRIEGRLSNPTTNFNCRKCSFPKDPKRKWVPFVWIPEQ